MGRPRGFDEAEVVESASRLFAERAYGGVSVDDLVAQLGVYRNSLYKTFGSKRGLYLAAFRWHLEHRLPPLLSELAAARDLGEVERFAADDSAGGSALDLLLMAAIERAAEDAEVAAVVAGAFHDLEHAIASAVTDRDRPAGAPQMTASEGAALLLGLRLRARVPGLTGSQTA